MFRLSCLSDADDLFPYKLYVVVVRSEELHNRIQACQAITTAISPANGFLVQVLPPESAVDDPTKLLIYIKAAKGREHATMIQTAVETIHQDMRITNKANITLYAQKFTKMSNMEYLPTVEYSQCCFPPNLRASAGDS